MDISPEEVARLAKEQQARQKAAPSMSASTDAARVRPNENPYMGRVEHAPYRLGHLFKDFPDRFNSPSEEVKLKADAARQHAGNGKTTLMCGMQAIGALMIRVGTSEEGDLDAHNVTALGDLIQHLAVELMYLDEVYGYMDDVLIERFVTRSGGAK